MTPAVASVLALQLAAGAVVDAAAATELRGGVMQPEDGGGTLRDAVTVPVLQASPSLSAAVETERYAATAGYALMLSGIAEPMALALFHSGNAALEMRATPIVRLRSRLNLQAGEVDPLQAQLTLADNGRAADAGAPLPFAAGAASITAEADVTRRLLADVTLQGGANAIDTGAPQSLYTGALTMGARYALTRQDAGRLELSASHAQRGETPPEDFDAAPALSARAAWERAVGDHFAVGLGAGAAATALMRAGVWQDTSIRPVGDARLHAGLELPGGRAFSGDASVGVSVAPNIVGGIAESRAQAGLGVDAALAPGVSAGLAASGFVPLRVTGGAPLDMGAFGQLIARAAWSITDELRVDAAAWVTAMAPDGEPQIEALTATLGVSGHMPVWHTGTRPRGTDPRAGRNVGVRGIGAAPPPGRQLVEEPPAPPPAEVEAVPPELVPPMVQPPIEPPPPPPPVHLPKPRPPEPAPLGGDDDDDDDDDDSDGDGGA